MAEINHITFYASKENLDKDTIFTILLSHQGKIIGEECSVLGTALIMECRATDTFDQEFLVESVRSALEYALDFDYIGEDNIVTSIGMEVLDQDDGEVVMLVDIKDMSKASFKMGFGLHDFDAIKECITVDINEEQFKAMIESAI